MTAGAPAAATPGVETPAVSPASHWVEYGIEAGLLGLFMLSACLFSVLLFHPSSPLSRLVPDPFARRLLMGLAMGGTAVMLNYSRWGKRSGAHYNPAVTLTFLRLGRIGARDAAGYVAAQFLGAVAGVLAASLLAGSLLADASVRYAVTLPGPDGPTVAFGAELVISFVLMTVVLRLANHPRLGRWTGLWAAVLVATFITLESPLSGMSMNPARTVGSAVWARDWTALWIYFAAPLLGMLGAAQIHPRPEAASDPCAKLHHQNAERCIFCEFRAAKGTSRRPAAL